MDTNNSNYYYEDNEDEEYNYSEDEAEYQYSDQDEPSSGLTSTAGGLTAGTGSGSVDGRMNGAAGSSGSSYSALDYCIIDPAELIRGQEKLIDEISSVLNINKSCSAVLLRYFGWNKEKLFEQYCLDPEGTRASAGVQFIGQPPQAFPPGTRFICQICCETSDVTDTFSVGCGHRFCLECWKPYLTFKIGEGPSCIFTTCPAQGCREVVGDEVFKMIVKPDDFKKYSKYLLRSFVDINKALKWCPSPHCDRAVSASGGCPMIKCTCGMHFCFRCGEESHLPVACENLSLWQEKCRNESETANWILANTKKCPKCAVRIEKNQGCNHMSCRHCKHEFCWICLGSWAEHGTNTGGYYKCNRYDPSSTDQEETDAARAKAELDRYLHYYQRYANHSEAGKFAARMREQTERRMVELQESSLNSSWIDVQFLKAATEQLIECRRILKYTYVFAYYLPNGKEKNLFEYLQENLEKNTEHLSGLSELPLEKMERSEVINFTRVTKRFLDNLLAGVEDGLANESFSN